MVLVLSLCNFFKHSLTLQIAGYCRAPKAILMKFYPCGSLSDLIHSQAKKPKLAPFVYNDRLAVRLATDVACGVTDMHREGLFHSDLKVGVPDENWFVL